MGIFKKPPLSEQEKIELLTFFIHVCEGTNIKDIRAYDVNSLNPLAVSGINKILQSKNNKTVDPAKKEKQVANKVNKILDLIKDLSEQEKESLFRRLKDLSLDKNFQNLLPTSPTLAKNTTISRMKKRVIKGVAIPIVSCVVTATSVTSCTAIQITKHFEPFSTNSYENEDENNGIIGDFKEFVDDAKEAVTPKPVVYLFNGLKKADRRLDNLGAGLEKFIGMNTEEDIQSWHLKQFGFPVSKEDVNKTLQEVVDSNVDNANNVNSVFSLCMLDENGVLCSISLDDNNTYVIPSSKNEYEIIPYIRDAVVIEPDSTKTNLNTGENSALNAEKVTIIGVPNAEGQVLISYIDSYELDEDNSIDYRAFYVTDYSNLSESRQAIEYIEDKYFFGSIASLIDVAIVKDENEKDEIRKPGEKLFTIGLPEVTADGIKVMVLYTRRIEDSDTLMMIKTSIIDAEFLNIKDKPTVEQPAENIKPSAEEYSTIGRIPLYPTKNCIGNTEMVSIGEKVKNLRLYPKSGTDSIYVELTIEGSDQIVTGWIRKDDMKNLIVNSKDKKQEEERGGD